MRKLTLVPLIFLFLATAPGAQAQAPASAPASLPFTLKPLGHNVWAAIDDAKGDAGANAGFVIGDDGVLVIDTFEREPAAKQLLAEIRKLTGLPIRFVVNTHYHLDHVAGNAVFARAGAVILGHENIRTWIHTENLKFFGPNIKPEQKAMVEGLVAPEITYTSQISLFLGSRRILVEPFPGHTGGDSIVVIPDAQVVFCGDLFWRKTLPNLIDASTAPWIATLEKISAGRLQWTFVPGHGDVGNASDISDFRAYLVSLRAMLEGPVKEGKNGDALVSAVLPALTEKYGQWNFFKFFAKPDILNTAAELRGDKKIPFPGSNP